MLFCPRCSNLLLLDGTAAGVKWKCQTCPYSHKQTKKGFKAMQLDQKKLDAIETERKGGAFDSTALCQNCKKQGAYFHEMQTRSADEPATIFYQCSHCGNKWKDG